MVGYLEDCGIEILPLDATTSDTVAEGLANRFPTTNDWRDAKCGALRTRLGQDRKRVPATIDWLSAHLCPLGAVFVTDDTGPEFAHLQVIGTGELQKLLDEPE